MQIQRNEGDEKPDEMEEFKQETTEDSGQFVNYDQQIEDQLKKLNLKEPK